MPEGKARIPQTVPVAFSFEETFDVGEDSASPVGNYESPFPFTGTLRRLVIDLSPNNLNPDKELKVRAAAALAHH